MTITSARHQEGTRLLRLCVHLRPKPLDSQAHLFIERCWVANTVADMQDRRIQLLELTILVPLFDRVVVPLVMSGGGHGGGDPGAARGREGAGEEPAGPAPDFPGAPAC